MVVSLRTVSRNDLLTFFGPDVMECVSDDEICIAGGAALSFYTGKAFHTDVDIFKLSSNYNAEYPLTDPSGVQIVWTTAQTVDELLQNFPLSITQIAIDLNSAQIVATDQWIATIASGILYVDPHKFFSPKHCQTHLEKWLHRMFLFHRQYTVNIVDGPTIEVITAEQIPRIVEEVIQHV